MNEIRFPPWIGKQFAPPNLFETKLLVVGESFYFGAGTERTTDFTSQVIAWVTSGWRRRFYDGLIYVLTGKRRADVSDHTVRVVFDSLAFYNFVQSATLVAARQRPTKADWLESQNAFRRVLHDLSPNKLLICGRQVAQAVATTQTIVPVGSDVWRMEAKGRMVWGTSIVHPSSSRFRRDEARQQFERLRITG